VLEECEREEEYGSIYVMEFLAEAAVFSLSEYLCFSDEW
jgi:hypothetical protein